MLMKRNKLVRKNYTGSELVGIWSSLVKRVVNSVDIRWFWRDMFYKGPSQRGSQFDYSAQAKEIMLTVKNVFTAQSGDRRFLRSLFEWLQIEYVPDTPRYRDAEFLLCRHSTQLFTQPGISIIERESTTSMSGIGGAFGWIRRFRGSSKEIGMD